MIINKRGIIASLLAGVALQPNALFAQAETTDSTSELDEIIVTAQRRTQSLKEVPISIEAYSGDEILANGYRDLDQLANFSPTVLVESGSAVIQGTSIRGFGTTSTVLTMEQAVPIFVDGVHFGSASYVKSAFMDVERIEVLKGPQPVYFGQNATAGAISIVSRKPTDSWEGLANLSLGSFGRKAIAGGIGGPLSDTFGIRIAGQYQKGDGYLQDVITEETEVGGFENVGGRITLQWKPSENFEATAKFEIARQDQEPEAVHICLTDGPLVFGRRGPTDPGDEGNEQSVWAEPPKGEGMAIPHIPLGECFENDLGRSSVGPHFEPPINIRERRTTTGLLDIRDAGAGEVERQQREGIREGGNGLLGYGMLNSHSSYVDLVYTFADGIELNSKTAFSVYEREFLRDDSYSPFAGNNQSRGESRDQWSSELRLTSPVGDVFEWMVGLYWQDGHLDAFSDNLRAVVRRGQRFNYLWQDTTWKAAFAAVTFNFLDDKASIDIGGRYSEVTKMAQIHTAGASWIYDVFPCAPGPDDDEGGGNFDPSTCAPHPDAIRVDPATDNPRIFDESADTSNLWTFPFNVTRATPSTWRGPRADAVGLTELDFSIRNGPYTDNRHATEFDPQVVLRYRPNESHSLYAKWAQSFKAGGFDTGVSTIPDTIEAFSFGPEFSESYELGARGDLWGSRAGYSLTYFDTTFSDLQLSTATPSLDDPRNTVNVGEQRVRGIEFSILAAVSDRARIGLSGAVMDGEMTDYPGAGCTRAEFLNAPESGCDPVTEKIDRTGSDAPLTPDWKFVVNMDYELPVMDGYQLSFSGIGYLSDGYLLDVQGFSKIIKYNRHGDISLNIGFGDASGTWKVSAYGRNLLEARPSYNEEFDVVPDGLEVYKGLDASAFRSYGIEFTYNYL